MIQTITNLALALNRLNDNKEIKCWEKYPVLKTELTNSEVWWDKMKFSERVDVGSVAIHYGKMTPNYKWACRDNDNYADLTKGQKKIVNFVLSKKDDNWFMFDIASMLKL